MRIKWHWLLLLARRGRCSPSRRVAAATTTRQVVRRRHDRRGPEGGTLVFAGAADPVLLDGALVSDGESLRVITQIFETLVVLKPGTTEPEPGLAESWEPNDDGTVWTFKIREGVKFHDGETLDAEAVCFNFDRWYNFKGAVANPAASYYWQVVFGGFKTFDPDSGAPEESLYKSCEATDDSTAVLDLTKPSATFIPALSHCSRSRSPARRRCRSSTPTQGTIDADGVFTSDRHVRHRAPDRHRPVQVRLVESATGSPSSKNDDYWGDKAKLDKLIIRPIADNAARLQALQTGEIQGYDLVEPQDIATIEGDSNLQILDRPAFNVAYVGYQQAKKPTDNLKVREAIAYGLDRQAVVDNFYSGRGEVAKEFMPPEVEGLRRRRHGVRVRPGEGEADPAGRRATRCRCARVLVPDRRLASVHAGPEAELRGVRREPEQVRLQGDPEERPWSPDYLGRADEGNAGTLDLLGWTGDYGDAGQLHRHVLPEPAEGLGHDRRRRDADQDLLEQGRDRDGHAKREDDLPGREPDDHGLSSRASPTRTQAGARVQREREGLRRRARRRTSRSRRDSSEE